MRLVKTHKGDVEVTLSFTVEELERIVAMSRCGIIISGTPRPGDDYDIFSNLSRVLHRARDVRFGYE